MYPEISRNFAVSCWLWRGLLSKNFLSLFKIELNKKKLRTIHMRKSFESTLYNKLRVLSLSLSLSAPLCNRWSPLRSAEISLNIWIIFAIGRMLCARWQCKWSASLEIRFAWTRLQQPVFRVLMMCLCFWIVVLLQWLDWRRCNHNRFDDWWRWNGGFLFWLLKIKNRNISFQKILKCD